MEPVDRKTVSPTSSVNSNGTAGNEQLVNLQQEFPNLENIIKMSGDSYQISVNQLEPLFRQLNGLIWNVDKRLSGIGNTLETLMSNVSRISSTDSDGVFAQIKELDDKISALSAKIDANQSSSSCQDLGPTTSSNVDLMQNTNDHEGSNTIAIRGADQPLCPTYSFPFHIGDITFHSFEQALRYIHAKFIDRPDLAAKVKATGSASEAILAITGFPEDTSWDSMVKEVIFALFQEKLRQCIPFAESVHSCGSDALFAYCSVNKFWGTGIPKTSISRYAPDKYPGQNIYGVWLKEFMETLSDPDYFKTYDEIPMLDLEKYCTCPHVRIERDQMVLVLGDIQLSGFMPKLGTKLITDQTMCAVSHPKGDSHTAKLILENILDLPSYGALVLLFGTYEVGKTPELIEEDYTNLLQYITAYSQHLPIFVANALPRTDKYADSLQLANYAISVAVRKFLRHVHLLDVSSALANVPNWRSFLKTNGFQLSEDGAIKYGEILADKIPFINLLAPQKVKKGDGRPGNGLSTKRPRRTSTGSIGPGKWK